MYTYKHIYIILTASMIRCSSPKIGSPFIYIYIYIYIYIHTYVPIHINIDTYTYICIHINTYM